MPAREPLFDPAASVGQLGANLPNDVKSKMKKIVQVTKSRIELRLKCDGSIEKLESEIGKLNDGHIPPGCKPF